MAFPLQSTQQAPNIPPDRIPMFPDSFMQGPQRLDGGLRNGMQPSGAIPGAPKGNMLKTMLGRFLPKGNARKATDSPSQVVSGSNPTGGGITSTLGNVQQVLHIVQQTAPIVKEYGPMVKNIPTMLRMAKAFKNLDDDEPESSTGQKQGERSEINTKETQKAGGKDGKETGQLTSVQTKEYTSNTDGDSKPLLFI